MKWQEEMIRTYLIEMMRQRDFALHSANGYIAARKKFKQQKFTYGNSVEMYAAAQALLTAAAQISKLLWVVMPKENPPGSGFSDQEYAAKRTFSLARAKAVRKALNVTDDSILKNRQVRNAVEHFDERMDTHIFTGAGPLVDSNISSINDVDGLLQDSLLRHIDPYTNQISVLDKAIRLKDLWDAVDAIGTTAAARHDETVN